MFVLTRNRRAKNLSSNWRFFLNKRFHPGTWCLWDIRMAAPVKEHSEAPVAGIQGRNGVNTILFVAICRGNPIEKLVRDLPRVCLNKGP